MNPPVSNGAAVQPRTRVAAGRVAALFDQNASMVLGLCRLLLRDYHEAEDAAQQTFVSAYRSLLRGTEPRDPAPWLAAIARNECRARIRKRMRAPLALDGEIEDQLSDLSPDLAEETDRRAELEALTAAIAELPARQREAVALRDFLGLSYEEVASTLSVSVPVVESLLFRARRRLRDTVRTVPRYAAGFIAFPFAIRAALWRESPDLGSGGGAGLVGAAGAAVVGAAAKVISLPFATKAATALTVAVAATVGSNIGGGGNAPNQPSGGQAAAISQPSSGGSTVAGAAQAPSDTKSHSQVKPESSGSSGEVTSEPASSGSVLVADHPSSSKKPGHRKHQRRPQSSGDVASQPTRDIVNAGATAPGAEANTQPSTSADQAAQPAPDVGAGDPSTWPVIDGTAPPVIGSTTSDPSAVTPAPSDGSQDGAAPIIGDTGGSTPADSGG